MPRGAQPEHVLVWTAVAVTVICLVVIGIYDDVPLVPYIAVLIVAFELGHREAAKPGLAAVIAIVAASEFGVIRHGDAPVPYLFMVPAAWAAGQALQQREIVARRLAERGRELDEERQAYAELSVRYERTRIASELHDIVAHALSVMVVQASAGQRLADVEGASTADTFAAIAEAAHQAEQDMGRLVDMLSDEDAIGPAPDLALIEELVARAAGSGLDVTLRLEGERNGIADRSVELAYRVVRESLTNALRYASGAAVRVLVKGTSAELLVEVTNEPAPAAASLAGAGTGSGLQGLRERIGTAGGSLDAGPTTAGGWRVSARLPRRIAAPA